MGDAELELRSRAVDRIAHEFGLIVVKHIPGRVVVTSERIHGKPSLAVLVPRAGLAPLDRADYFQRVDLDAEPVPDGWAYARSPQDLIRA